MWPSACMTDTKLEMKSRPMRMGVLSPSITKKRTMRVQDALPCDSASDKSAEPTQRTLDPEMPARRAAVGTSGEASRTAGGSVSYSLSDMRHLAAPVSSSTLDTAMLRAMTPARWNALGRDSLRRAAA